MKRKPLTLNARSLRRDETRAEKLLWKYLRGRKLDGYKFRRQHPIDGKFILDFYCFEAKLGIEIDGQNHLGKAQMEYDQVRTKYLL